jgi:MFS transporter, BCD family, chlorophyll transporter
MKSINKSPMHFLKYLRLAGFPVGLGLTSALVSGTLNRVMIVELSLPASLVGLLFSLPLLISPLRVWLGYHSDAYPIFELRREPYILLGAFLTSLGVIVTTLVLINLHSFSLWSILPVILLFLVYGMGKNLSSNTFEALLADKFSGDQRPKAVTLFKIAMFVGIIGGAILLGRLLDPFSPATLITVVVGVMTLVFVISILGSLKQEPRSQNLQIASQQSRATNFVDTIKTLILPDPQVRVFFIIVMLTVLGTLAQDVLLEPYGALVLDMTVGQTARLTAIWGSGTVLAMAISGMWFIKKFGYSAIMQTGLLLGAFTFIGLLLSGIWNTPPIFSGLVFLLGISTGLSAAGMLTAVIEFTTPARAGLLMGVWGLAHELGQAGGNLMGGLIVDFIRAITLNNNLIAYGTVFLLEAGLLFTAWILVKRLNLSQSAAFNGSGFHGEGFNASPGLDN